MHIKMQWVVFIFFPLITIQARDVPEFTLISQKIPSELKFNTTCVVSGNSTKSAIIWNEQIPFNEKDIKNSVSEYIPPRNNPYNCKINNKKNQTCNKEWAGKNEWTRQTSFYSKLGPVTDYRWEEFNIYYTNKNSRITTIAAISEPNFKIHISIRMKEEAYIYLCDDEHESKRDCYLILLGGREGDESNSIKICDNGTMGNAYSKNVCRTLRGELRRGFYDSILSEVEWRHFTIEKQENILSLWQIGGKTPTLTYSTDSDESMLDVKYLNIRSGESPGLWKLHQYTYTFTNNDRVTELGPTIQVLKNNICLAMFVAMCDLCNLKLEVFYHNTVPKEIIKTIVITPKEGMEWQEEKLFIWVPDNSKFIQLRVHTICPSGECKDPFWAIDDFQICSKNEIRVLSITQDRNTASCQLIKYPHSFLSQTDLQSFNFREGNCIGATFSKSCIECSTILGPDKPSCDYSIICDLQWAGRIVCRCATGYTGQLCETSLGKVEELGVPQVDATSITIGWKPRKEANHRKITSYIIRYKHLRYLECENENEESKHFIKSVVDVQSDSVKINNLHPYSEYVIEIVEVSSSYGIPTTINVNTLPTVSLDQNTEIPGIKSVEPSSTQVKITLEEIKCELIKGPIAYNVTLVCSNPWCSQDPVNTIYFENTPIILNELHPFSNYTVKIKVERRHGNVLNGNRLQKSFQTSVFAPSTIKNITVYTKNKNSISLRFLPPYPPNGIIQHYYIKFSLTRDNVIQEQPKFEHFQPNNCKIWKNFHCVSLNNLKPNKKYEIAIYAKNIDTSYNDPEIIYATTTEEQPDVIENLNYEWDNYCNLTLNWGHPNRTNGVLTKFLVTITDSDNNPCYNESLPMSEENYNITYSLVIPFDKCFGSYIIIKVAAVNKYQGPFSRRTTFSPPETPSFNTALSVETITNSTVTIKLPVPNKLTNYSVMYVIVSNKNISSNITNEIEILPKIWDKLGINLFSWIIEEYDYTKDIPQTFLIGNETKSKSKRLNKVLYNRKLNISTTYIISVIINNQFGNFQRYKISQIEARTSNGIKFEEVNQSETSNDGLWVLLPFFILLLIILIIIFRKRKECKKFWLTRFAKNWNFGHVTENSDAVPLTENKLGKISQFQLRFKPKAPVSFIYEEAPVVQRSMSKINKGFSKPIKIIEFEKYVKESIADGELERQHQLLPRGQIKPWDCGLLPQNKYKNRYNNLLAYDCSRVILSEINNDPYSDYINANYIEGYNTKKTYIATQGPKATTMDDFWRMIWQENVRHIVVLANVIEGGNKKTEQYWPNINESLEFGNIKIEYVSSRVYEDCERRRFTVSFKNVERKVEQLHFTSWPDHGVPFYPHRLVPFVRKILTIPQGTSPIVVHCSAGVGRTGTIILCDLCLRMIGREGVVDVLKHQSNLREQRVNLVDNFEQYKLAHLVLLECLVAPQTNINCDEEAEVAISRLLESEKIKQLFIYLNETTWQDEAMRPTIETKFNPECSKKNRFQNIIPCGYGRVKLSYYPVSDEQSDYINAVEVDGFRSPQRFIVTQQPLPHTKTDFWRMIEEKGVTTIISLNEINFQDETCCVFWPTENEIEIEPVPYLTLQFQNNFDTDHYKIVTINMWNKEEKENKRTIKLITLKGWASTKTLPDEEISLIKLWEELIKVYEKNNKIVITCYDGAKASGLFIALSIVLEKIKFEQECDVCSAVRTVRHNRREFILDLEQFSFLYHAAIKYLNCFDLYSNISPP